MTKNEMNAIAEVFGDLFKKMASAMPDEAPVHNEPKASKYKASKLQKDTELLDSDQWHMMEGHNMHERLRNGNLTEDNTNEMLSIYTRLIRNHTMCVIYLHQMETCERDIDEKAFNLMKTAMERFETITADLIDKLGSAILHVNGIFTDDEDDDDEGDFEDDFDDDDDFDDEDDEDDGSKPCNCRSGFADDEDDDDEIPDFTAVLRVHGVPDDSAADITAAVEALLKKMKG